jgi:hypothetical protein
MMTLGKRVEKLEQRVNPPVMKAVHVLFRQLDQTEDEVLDAYGRERIGADDLTIIVGAVEWPARVLH